MMFAGEATGLVRFIEATGELTPSPARPDRHRHRIDLRQLIQPETRGAPMTIDHIRDLLGWCTAINFGFLMFWFVFYLLLHDFAFRVHGKMFRLTEAQFNGFNYAGMITYKMAIILFNLVPFLVLDSMG